MSFTETAWEIFNKAIADYHIQDSTEAACKNNFQKNTLEHFLYAKNWIDTVQWHLEDIIRDEDISPENALLIKRRIDASNQERTELVEFIDDWFLNKFANIQPDDNARLNTETPAWAVDRLSILALKIYHMEQEATRETASAEHREKCSRKLHILKRQKEELCVAISQLLSDIENGMVKMATYKQMKMYNDESLNPILYKNKGNAQKY